MNKKLIAGILSLSLILSSAFSAFAEDATPIAYAGNDNSDKSTSTIAVQIGNYAATVDSMLVSIDPDNRKVVPYIKNNRTYIPLKFIGENLGAQVSWDSKKREAIIQKDNTKVVIPVNKSYYYINSVKHNLDAPAEIYQNRTFVPMRFVAEALNMAVYWDKDAKMAVIAPKDRQWTGVNSIEEDLIVQYLILVYPFLKDHSVD